MVKVEEQSVAMEYMTLLSYVSVPGLELSDVGGGGGGGVTALLRVRESLPSHPEHPEQFRSWLWKLICSTSFLKMFTVVLMLSSNVVVLCGLDNKPIKTVETG